MSDQIENTKEVNVDMTIEEKNAPSLSDNTEEEKTNGNVNDQMKNIDENVAEMTIEEKNTPSPCADMVEKKTTVNDNVGVYMHKFKTPFEYAGMTYETLTFYFSRLTGRDMVSIETEMQNRNEYALAPEISRNFLCIMAAKSAGIGSDVLEAMPLKDFNKITNAARDFLLDTGY